MALPTSEYKHPLLEIFYCPLLQVNYEIMRQFMILRASLVPYIYSSARLAYDEGLSLLRPLYYLFPEDPEAYMFDHQYMFGPDLLVAPVTQPVDSVSQMVSKEIWIPEVSSSLLLCDYLYPSGLRLSPSL